jgi:hypothetical protein
VGIPRLAVAVIDLDESYSAFGEPAGQQAAICKMTPTIAVAGCSRLFLNVERIRGVHLHAVRGFHGADARLQVRIVRTACLVISVDALHEFKLAPLLIGGEFVVL